MFLKIKIVNKFLKLLCLIVPFTICCSGQRENKYGETSQNSDISMLEQKLSDNDKIIEFERIFGECLGKCPAYQVSIFGNGKIEFTGNKNTRVIGKAYSNLSDADLQYLIEVFEKSKFIDFSDKYVRGENCSKVVLSDGEYIRIQYKNRETTKEMLHYSGCRGTDFFDKLELLENEIDRIANTKRWIK